MAQYVQRESYLRQLIDRKDNGEVKIITALGALAAVNTIINKVDTTEKQIDQVMEDAPQS